MINKGIPEGMHTLTPHLTVSDAAGAIEFYKQAFGAQELMRSNMPSGRVMHAHLKIGDSDVLLNDSFPEHGGPAAPTSSSDSSFAIQLYVEDVDQVFNRAIQAGAQVKMPLTNMFWGDRYGQIVDPYGYRWAVATRIEEVSPEEAERRAQKMFGTAA